MTEKTSNFLKKLRGVFALEPTICRLIAAWCGFAAINLFIYGEAFFKLDFAQNTSLLRLILITAVFFAGFSAVKLLLSDYETDSIFLLIGATVCVARWLSVYATDKGEDVEFLFLLAVIAVYFLFVIYSATKNKALLDKWTPKGKTVAVFAAVFGLICGGVIAGVTCLRYLTFSSPNFDFGLFVNMFHNMKETGLPLCTSERDVLMTHFAVHISPIYYLLLPFYWLFPSPLTLQIGQALAVASGVIPAVLLCRHFKLSGKTTILIALIYSLYPALSSGCFYDIHENCFLTPLLLWTFYFFEREKYPLMYIFALLTLGVKEDAAVYVVIFALFIMLSKHKWLHGAILLGGALAYFGGALAILSARGAHYAELYAETIPNPSISGPMINRFNNLIFNSEDGLLGVIKTALVNPGYLLTQLFTTPEGGWEKLIYFLSMFLPLGMLPFCTKKVSRWLLVAPILMNLLTNYQYQYDTGYQYHFGISAFLIYAAVMNIPELHAPTRKTLVTFAATACLCLYVFSVLPTLTYYNNAYERNKTTYRQMEQILDTIPEDASVCCSTFLLAHVADRDVVYDLKYHGNEGDTDYVIIDTRNSTDKAKINVFLAKGYSIKEQHEDVTAPIVILVKQNN